MDGFEKRRQQKKDSILSSALELFKQYGYSKVSIAEIAKRASVSQVSIYNFFGSKENLKKELLMKLLNEHMNKTQDILNSSDPVEIRFERLLMTRIDYFRNYTVNFLLETIGDESLLKEFMEGETYQKGMSSIYNLFEQGKKEGVFNASISTEAMFTYMEIFQTYLIHTPSFLMKIDANPTFAKEIFCLFTDGLFKR